VTRQRFLRRLTRGLRFRVTAGYALFFAILVTGTAALFRARLSTVLENQAEENLRQEWAAVKGYLRIDNYPPKPPEVHWYYDPEDPDETFIVERLRRVLLLTDASGTNELFTSTTYDSMSKESPATIRERVRLAMTSYIPGTEGKFFTDTRYSEGEPYLIRAGIVFDEAHKAAFYLAIGTPLTNSQRVLRDYTLFFLGFIPAALILGSWLGWYMAGRALTPVLGVAQAAQRISGSNLSMRIPTREADDEIDYLIMTFNRMIGRLEASFQQMKQFSADVSHELRTPLTAIRGQLEVALFTAKTTEQYRDAMVNALQDVDRLTHIVRALLLLSQAESGQLALQKTTVDLSEVVQDLVEQFQIPAEAEGVRLVGDVPPLCPAEVDRVQIERMITNLLSNAVKFSPGGRVRVELRSIGSSVEIVVEDTGCGIPQESLPHIFDRFYRVPGSGTAPGPDQGLGLGLSFVAWIVKAHHGTIDVQSRPGKGTRFTIEMPAGHPQSAGVETGQPILN
jgi:heavy metal sensor kinase